MWHVLTKVAIPVAPRVIETHVNLQSCMLQINSLNKIPPLSINKILAFMKINDGDNDIRLNEKQLT
jgi:hypothetical protein